MEKEKIQIDPGMLYGMRNVLLLAAFACEARRVLTDLDTVASLLPELDATLSVHIAHRAEWTTYENTTADVLRFVAGQLDTWEAPI